MHPDKIESFYGHMKILLPEHRRIQRIDIKRLFLLNLHPWVNLFKGRGNGKEREGKEKDEREGESREGREGGGRKERRKTGKEDRGQQITKLALIRCSLCLYEQVGLEKPLIHFEAYFWKVKCKMQNLGKISYIYIHTHIIVVISG